MSIMKTMTPLAILLLAIPAATAQTICVLNCTAYVSLPPATGAGVAAAGVSENVYFYQCTTSFEQIVCARTGGSFGAQGVYVACPPTEPGMCFMSGGGQIPGGAGNVAIGFISVVQPNRVCALTGLSGLGTQFWSNVTCIPHDWRVTPSPTSPEACLAVAVEDDRFSGPGPFRCVSATIEDEPPCVVVVADGNPVEVVCQRAPLP